MSARPAARALRRKVTTLHPKVNTLHHKVRSSRYQGDHVADQVTRVDNFELAIGHVLWYNVRVGAIVVLEEGVKYEVVILICFVAIIMVVPWWIRILSEAQAYRAMREKEAKQITPNRRNPRWRVVYREGRAVKSVEVEADSEGEAVNKAVREMQIRYTRIDSVMAI